MFGQTNIFARSLGGYLSDAVAPRFGVVGRMWCQLLFNATQSLIMIGFASLTKDIQVEKGKSVYMQTCFVCHQPTGLGVPGQIPPLAESDFLIKNKEDAIRAVVIGRTGETVVNGKTYKGTMIPLAYLTDDQIANVLTYVRNSWGNASDAVSAADVAKIRAEAAAPAPNATPAPSKFE